MDTANVDWYLLRSSGVVALVLLTAATALGIATANRWRIEGQPRFVTAALHRNISLLAVALLVVHVVTTLLDPDAAVSFVAVFVPLRHGANALWVALGALGLDVLGAVTITSLVRRRLGYRAWRAVHWLAYAAWPLAFAHGVGMGTDGPDLWFQAVSLGCLAVVVAAAAVRYVVFRPGRRLAPPLPQ